MGSWRLWVLGVLTLLALTIWLLPLPETARLFLLATAAFAAVFVAFEAGGKGKVFAALISAALALYLAVTLGRGLLLIQSGDPVGLLLGLALLVLPLLGGWSMLREIYFGSQIQQMGQELEAAGALPEDRLPRSPAGRIDRQAADAQFAPFAQQVEAEPTSWANWFRLALAYDASGDRKRARKSMRTALALRQGKKPKSLSL
ncbi:MAG: hypothetical protein SOR40_08785 [Rothia sp. (in: high G+C Gram-positive bacteria)]|nr:hypothetical protein [Rothia sp. (in: high G+C Gram-positive bacteria)]